MSEHVFKLYENVLDGRLRELVDINKMQYGFMPGRGTVDAVLVLRTIKEKFRDKNKNFFVSYLLTWKRLLIGCQGKLFVLL